MTTLSTNRASATAAPRSGFPVCAWRFARSLFALALFGFVLSGIRPRPLEAQQLIDRTTLLDPRNLEDSRYHVFQASNGTRGVGGALAHAGDVDNDGWPDLLVASGTENPGPGRVWVVLGGPGLPPRVGLDDLPERSVVVTTGLAAPDQLGSFVAGAGDLDGDGIDDFLVGMSSPLGPELPEGAVFLVFGSENIRPLSLSNLGDRGVIFRTLTQGTLLGGTGSGIGDINGDGYADIALGVPDATAPGDPAGPPRGKVYVIFGSPDLRTGASVVDLDSVDGQIDPSLGFEIAGPAVGAHFGSTVAAVGNVDGDEHDDFALAAPSFGAGGAVFVIFGRDEFTSAPDLETQDTDSHVELRSTIAGSHFGDSLAGGLDATGNGAPDILVGAPEATWDESPQAGVAILIPGGSGIRDRAVRSLPEPGAPVFYAPFRARAGASVALVPDVDGDDLSEVLIGAPGALNLGLVYLAYGNSEFEDEVSLAALVAADGARGAQLLPFEAGTRLGETVVGLPDRRGSSRGSFAVGAPGTPLGENPQAGLVYEVFARPRLDSPRHLTCELLPDRRVRLAWMVPTGFRRLTVFRNGLPISGALPGTLLGYIDVDPPPDRNEYWVEANGDPRLVSDRCRVDVRPLEVRDFLCQQVPGSTAVVVRWTRGDRYGALRVLINGQPVAEGDLDSSATQFRFDRGPGTFDVAVFDPTSQPQGFRAQCTIEVIDVNLAAIQGFQCEVLDGPAVELDWIPSDDYQSYLIKRNDIPMARVPGPPVTDDRVHGGGLKYTLIGIRNEIHPGPEAECVIDLEVPHDLLIRGRVVFDDTRSTPLLRGHVEARVDDGAGVSRTQVNANGEFVIGVPDEGPFTLVFTAQIDPLADHDLPILSQAQGIVITHPCAVAGEVQQITVPLPILSVATQRSDQRHWDSLKAGVAARSLIYAAAVPAGVGEGTLAIHGLVEVVLGHLGSELGHAPSQFDLVAFGSAGLSARVFTHTQDTARVRKLVLLGTPNLGTVRANAELRKDIASRPQPGGLRVEDASRFAAADEQTPRFLEKFNRRITATRGADVHLVAGFGGDLKLNPLFDCDSHDGRVCVASALGGIPGATTHLVIEEHALLGRGNRSLAVLLGEVGLALPRDPCETPGGLDDKDDDEGAEVGGRGAADAGRGAGVEGSDYSTGNVYDGILQPGDSGDLPLHSDTSGSIIIILNTEEPGGFEFLLTTPSGLEVSPNMVGFGIEYVSFTDGEGQAVQAYSIDSAEIGSYTAAIANPSETAAIAYHLELVVDGGTMLSAVLDPDEVDPSQGTQIRATLANLGTPVLDAAVTGQVYRPNGNLELITLLDDGVLPDATPADGVYTAAISPSAQPGFHIVALTASDPPDTTFQRAETLQLLVRSNAAILGDGWQSGTADADGDGVPEGLWIDGEVTTATAGTFLLVGTLADLDGDLVAETGTLFDVNLPDTVAVRLFFDGEDLYSSNLNGPYVLEEVELIDVSVGFVRADFAEDVHQTEQYFWWFFGLAGPLEFLRGDVNVDGQVDIADPILGLIHLFRGAGQISCDDAADANQDGGFDISDIIALLDFLFRGGSPVPSPFPDCGVAPDLGCTAYPPCN